MSEQSVLLSRPWRRPQYLSSVPYLPGLDGMRALAVAMVIVYHANPNWLHGGFLGVEVFFVISGYLITLLLMAETERTGRIDLGAFWMRRFRRLLPALYALLAVTVVYTAFFRSNRLAEIRGDVVSALVYVSNWWQVWVGADYAGADRFAPLNHLWSLAVEEQFYLVWPVVMLLLLRRGSRKVVAIAPWLFALAIVITIVNSVLIYTGPVINCELTPDGYWQFGGRCFNIPNTLYLSTISRAGGLMIGSGFAMMWRPMAIMRGPLREASNVLDILGVLGLAGIGALSWFIYFIGPEGADGWLFRGGFFATDIATLMVIASVTHRYSMMGRILGNPMFVWIGQRSYGLYLYHWLIFQMIRKVTGIPLTVPQFAASIVATVVVSELSYRVLETPIRKREVGVWWARLRRQSDRMPLNVLMAGSLVVVALVGFSTVRMVTAQPPTDDLESSLASGRENSATFDELLDPDSAAVAEAQARTGTTVAVDPASGQPDPSVPTESTTASTVETTVPESTTTLPEGKLTKLAIGDSVMLGALDYLQNQGWTVSAQEGQQMKDVVPFIEELAAQDRIGAPVLIHLGTNGPISEETVNALLDPLTPDKVNLVLIYNIRSPDPRVAQNNTILANIKRPNVIVVDWNNLSNKCPGNCFYDDSIHLRPDGQRYYERIATNIWNGKPADS